LREIFDPPACLFIQGAIEALHQPYSLGVVGTRKHTPYGQQLTQHLVEGLAGHPLSIISGLALGIDGFAHASALNAGLVTVGVLANGLDTIYPPQHVGLAEQIIAAGGALLSEQPLGMPPDASLFPRRNRLVVGLSQALLVSEAPLKSGSMISAHIALEENRTVLTVPGDVRALNSGGPHWLLRQGGIPVWDPSHVVEALGLPPLKQAPAPKTLPTSPFNSQANPQVGQSLQPQQHRATGATPVATEAATQPALTNTLSNPVPPAEYAALWALLPPNGRDAVSLDALAQAANLPPTELLTALTMMELEGWVRMEAGNQVLRHWPA
jgi:DNA protecting protein DprA